MYIQLLIFAYIRLLNKPYETEGNFDTLWKLFRSFIPKSLKSFLGSFHQALKHSKFSTYACPASSTKKCVNFLFVLNFPKMARVPHTTLKVFTLSWISLTSVVEYFFTWSDMLFDWYQERLTIERKKSIGCGSTRSGTSCFFTFWFHEM